MITPTSAKAGDLYRYHASQCLSGTPVSYAFIATQLIYKNKLRRREL